MGCASWRATSSSGRPEPVRDEALAARSGQAQARGPLAERRSAPSVLVVGDWAELSRWWRLAPEFALARGDFAAPERTLLLRAARADLVLLDGADSRCRPLCRRLQGGELGGRVPVAVFTRRADAECELAAFAMGALDYLHGGQSPAVRLARVRRLVRGKLAADLLGRQARSDSLTGIANRREFDRVLELEWRRAIRSRAPLSLLLMDIDHFKSYNDAHGHAAGDACLRQVALAIRGALRRAADLAARYGGEEFACILPATRPAGALALAGAIAGSLRGLGIPHPRRAGAGVVTLSAGVATATPSPRQPPARLLEAADSALYQAKRAGRDRVVATA